MGEMRRLRILKFVGRGGGDELKSYAKLGK